MILRQLVLEDFGLYHGVQTIELAPHKNGQRLRPVVLFGGQNGAGKSTIFEAILVCLYGKGAFGDRVRQTDYFEFLFRRIHRCPEGMQSSRASVSVEFEFVQTGIRHLYDVRRSWTATNGTAASIDVSVDLRRDGQRLDDLDHSHWDDFLRELIPPGLSRLFFFDGEKIQRLAEEQDSRELGQSVKSLLSLDLVERLSADLQVYMGRQAKQVARDVEREEMERLEGTRESLRERLECFRNQRASLQSTKLDPLSSRVESIERRLRAEGSELTKSRDSLFTEKAKSMALVEAQEERLRELCSSTLPFALCPRLTERMKEALIAGANSLSGDARKRVLGAASEVLQHFASGELNGVETVDARVRRKTATAIEAELKKAIKKLGNVRTGSKHLDEIAPSERSRMLTWIESVFLQTAPEAKAIGDTIEKHVRRLQKVEAALQQMPSDESLKATLAELTQTHEELGAAEHEAKTVDEEVAKCTRDLADVERRLDLLTAKIGAAKDAANRILLVKRSQEALREYLIAVTQIKLTQLEHEVTKCFAELCRKGDLVRGVRIDAESFEVILLGKNGESIPKDTLSAGEKQIFAVALLWALARTSGRPLPVIIDTPLARLDSRHRKLLIERYLPSASHQVLVLSTDTEVDAALFSMLQPFVSHSYHLQYDGENRCTTATPGYFWRSDVDVEAAAS